MKYVYTSEMCGACIKLKKQYDTESIKYIERDASRLKQPVDNYDDIDKEALVQLMMQNETLPVVVEI